MLTGSTILITTKRAHTKTAKLIKDDGKNSHTSSSSASTEMAPAVNMKKLPVARYIGPTPPAVDFLSCCQFGDLESIKTLYQYCTYHGRCKMAAMRDSQERTALHQATEGGHFEVVQWLVDVLGVDVNALDCQDWTALHSACRVGRSDQVLYLISRGADVDIASNSGCLPLNYFVRHCNETDVLKQLDALSLLCPSGEYLLSLNDRGESLLHYACLNTSPNVTGLVHFLLSNGVDPTIKNERGDRAVDFLAGAKKDALSAVLGGTDEGDDEPSLSKSMQSMSVLPTAATAGDPATLQPRTFLSEYQEQEEDKLLHDLSDIKRFLSAKVKMEGEDAAELSSLLQRIDANLDELRPAGSVLDADHIYNLGPKFAASLSQELSVHLSNRTSRKFLMEGKMMRCGVEDERKYLYYFLFSDILIFFVEASIRAKKVGEDVELKKRDMRLMCLDELTLYDVPDACGVRHGVQVVCDAANSTARFTETFLLPTEEQKTNLLSAVQQAIQTINSNFDMNASSHCSLPEDDDVLFEGELVKQGLVINTYHRVYVRYTVDELYYYASKEAEDSLGVLSLDNLVVKFDNKKMMIRWCDTKVGRSANFCALNNASFREWKAALVGKGTSINSSSPAGEPVSHSGAVSVDLVLHSGRSLASMDVNGKSDPYVVLGLCGSDGSWLKGPRKRKTPVIRKTLNPHWKKGNKFTFVVPDPSYGIRVEVWDEDRLKKDDFMGLVFVTVGQLTIGKPLTSWFPLLPMPGQTNTDKVRGDLYITAAIKQR